VRIKLKPFPTIHRDASEAPGPTSFVWWVNLGWDRRERHTWVARLGDSPGEGREAQGGGHQRRDTAFES
jgi:hypothetical protein